MTDPEIPPTVSPPHGYHFGHPETQKEEGRGTLQTSALPLGYGATTHKLAIYLDFLNPPLQALLTSLNLCRAAALRYRRVTNGRDRWPSHRTRGIRP